jgi:hypothetical protein
MLLIEELREVRQVVAQHMETNGFVRPTLFLIGSKSRLGYTMTSIPSDLDEAAAATFSLGNQLAADHPEVGKLIRAYFAVIGLVSLPFSDEQEPREVLIVHGVETATNEQQAVVFEVLRDRTQHSLPFTKLQEFPSKAPIPEHPILQAFVNGYLSFD